MWISIKMQPEIWHLFKLRIRKNRCMKSKKPGLKNSVENIREENKTGERIK